MRPMHTVRSPPIPPCWNRWASSASNYHNADEYVEIDSIVPRLYLATRLVMDLSANESRTSERGRPTGASP